MSAAGHMKSEIHRAKVFLLYVDPTVLTAPTSGFVGLLTSNLRHPMGKPLEKDTVQRIGTYTMNDIVTVIV